MSNITSHSPLNISETVRSRLGSKGPLIGNGHGVSNGYVTDDVT